MFARVFAPQYSCPISSTVLHKAYSYRVCKVGGLRSEVEGWRLGVQGWRSDVGGWILEVEG
jgi:hypothetical protein